jgi:hypothetical protein
MFFVSNKRYERASGRFGGAEENFGRTKRDLGKLGFIMSELAFYSM